MAEMTKEMYGAIGRVGNKTYYQRMGKTIVRTRVAAGYAATASSY